MWKLQGATLPPKKEEGKQRNLVTSLATAPRRVRIVQKINCLQERAPTHTLIDQSLVSSFTPTVWPTGGHRKELKHTHCCSRPNRRPHVTFNCKSAGNGHKARGCLLWRVCVRFFFFLSFQNSFISPSQVLAVSAILAPEDKQSRSGCQRAT